MARGVVPLMGLETALAAICGGAGPRRRAGLAARVPRCRRATARLLDEAEGKALLAAAGVAVPRAVTAPNLAALDVGGLAPPFALKGLGFAHKTEAGAVRLGLTTLAGQAEMPGATGYLAEEMVTGAVAEVLLGLRRDPVYGVTLTLGMGGVTAEVLADTVTLVCPVAGREVAAALRRLRLWPLAGWLSRAAARRCRRRLARWRVRLGALMLADASLEEIEINPVMLRADGAVAVDALVRRAE
ncbi:MAG: acetate--CoA ligase family protein [Gemmobacter sp.]|nr:acetate--CoA ligase family protein [Gemmobacter sp.]